MKLKHIFLLFIIPLATYSWGQEKTAKDYEGVIKAMEGLSAATASKGGGVEAYGAILAEDFTRWTIGEEKLYTKEDWLKGLKSWFDHSMRVVNRKMDYIEMDLQGDFAFTRRIVTEIHADELDKRSTYKSALSEVWVKRKGTWLLLRADVTTMKD